MKAKEPDSVERPFRWRLVEEKVIEVVEGVHAPPLLVRYDFLGFADEVLPFFRLILWRKDALYQREKHDSEEPFPDDIHWPRPEICFFAYRGEPPNTQSIEPRAD
jgi:hypothetical protein